MVSLDEIAAVDSEVEQLEVQLERARQKQAAARRKKQLQDQRRLEEQAKRAAAERAKASVKDDQVSDLQRQIEALKAQLENDENKQPSKKEQAAPISPVRAQTVKESPAPPPTSPKPSSESSPSPPRSPARQPTAETKTSYRDRVQPAPEPVAPAKGASELAKVKHAWDKPDWALAESEIPADQAILSSPIQHGLKKAKDGYERKVFEKDLALVNGKFVAAQETVPDPRMVWIVVNMDGCKVGKICMHLYGNYIPLADVFTQLKGLQLHRSPHGYHIADIDPEFYVTTGTTPGTFSGPKSACYGVIFEGGEVLEQMQAASAQSVFTVKQSHIYPVKKAKSAYK